MIFRKRLVEYNSLEEVFSRIVPFFDGKLTYRENVLSYSSGNISGILKNIRAAAGVEAEVYHITGDVHYVCLGLPGRRTILTIHDFYSARRGSWLNRLAIRILWYWLPALRVRYITVISEWSRQELLKVIPFARKKIRVIPNPVMIPEGPFIKEFDAEEPAILMVGTKPNKNLEGMLETCRGMNCR